MFDRRFFLKAGGLAALGLLPWGSGVWNTPLHSRYEDELAQWWNEQGYRETIYSPTMLDKLLAQYGQLGDLRGFWSLLNRSAAVIHDDSGNGQDLVIHYPVSTVFSDTVIPYVQLSEPGPPFPYTLPLKPNLSAPHTTVLNLTNEATVGAWVRMPSGTPGGDIMAKRALTGLPAASNDYAFVLSIADLEVSVSFRHDGSLMQTSVDVFQSLPGWEDLNTYKWNLVVARFRQDDCVALTVNSQTETVPTAVSSAMMSNEHPFGLCFLGEDVGEPLGLDIALPFVCASYVPDSMIGLLWAGTRGFFGV